MELIYGDLGILLVDDLEIVREGIKLLVKTQADIKVGGEAANGEIAIKKTRELGVLSSKRDFLTLTYLMQ
ncbi:MAG TPA: hypothetical protein VK892_19235 [Pyrinomonadaceae bacterium]|nr:hypothetical protein [Pyrinomonadaceae bacterium]